MIFLGTLFHKANTDNDPNDEDYVDENERNIAPPANANNPIQQDERSVSSESEKSDISAEGVPRGEPFGKWLLWSYLCDDTICMWR